MGTDAALWLLITSITSTCLAVVSACISWRVGSRCTRAVKSLLGRRSTRPSDVKLAEAMEQQAALFSTLSKLEKTVVRLSSRSGMQEVRARQVSNPPPPGASKAELRKHYGLTGLSGPEFARKQMAMSLDPPTQETN